MHCLLHIADFILLSMNMPACL